MSFDEIAADIGDTEPSDNDAGDPVDEAMAAVMTASGNDQEDATIKELMDTVADEDELTQQEAIELTANKTRKTKSEAKSILDEAANERSQDLIDINSIEKIIPPADADPARYRFFVDVRGERGVIDLESDDLMSGRSFRRQIFELADRLVEFPEWQETLNEWFDTTEITERKQEPLSPEHALAESVLDRIRSMEFVEDYDEFRINPRVVAYHDPEDGVVLIAGMVIDDVRQSASGEVSMRRTRSILDEFLVGDAQRVRYEDGRFRAWRFGADTLATEAGVSELADDGREVSE